MVKILLIATLSLFGNSQVGEIAWFPSYCPAGWETYVPLSGKMPLGSSTQFPLGSTGGEITHTLTVDEIPSHQHFSGNTGWDNFYGGGSTPENRWMQEQNDCCPFIRNPYTSSTGGGNSHNNMPPFLSLQPCIRINATNTEKLEKENIKLRERLDSLEKKLDKLTASLKN